MSRRFRTPAALILVLACAGSLAGCGVKGPLEPPPKAAAGSPQAGSQGGTQPLAANAAPAASSDVASDSAWSVNQSTMVAQTGTATAPLAAAPPPMAAAPATVTGSSSGGAQHSRTHVGGTSTAPTSLDQVTRPNKPFILDGLL